MNLAYLAKLIRYYILTATTQAGSGHPTSSLSAVELMTVLFFDGFFKADLENPNYVNNDRLIFSKGHAAPLLYALYAVAGKVSDKQLRSLRSFESVLEGHPTMRFPYTETATGSLGQGLSIGVGIALNGKLDHLDYTTYVLLGDGELAEGSNWEAAQFAALHQLDNFVALVDVNRLAQTGETLHGYQIDHYQQKFAAFGWETLLIDGHDLTKIKVAYQQISRIKNKPLVILAKTIKGKGISFLQDKDNWHGKVLSQQQLTKALTQLGEIDLSQKGLIKLPTQVLKEPSSLGLVKAFNHDEVKIIKPINLALYFFQPVEGKLATRHAYGNALLKLGCQDSTVMVLDADMNNSTGANLFKQVFPHRFLQMYIAEQNMVGVGLGLATRGKIPFMSTFAAFLTRAFDQIRMAQYSGFNLNFVGSHSGVSMGQDGASQMGLEDIAMFRSIRESVVLYPSDATSTEKLVFAMAQYQGIAYLRTTRAVTPIIYSEEEQFAIGGSKVIKQSSHDQVTVVAAGITLHQALIAYQNLASCGLLIRVIDLYCIKPLDKQTLIQAAQDTQAIIVVEDHYQSGGIGEAVSSALINQTDKFYSLFVNQQPRSGSPEVLLSYEEIDAEAIVKLVKKLLTA